MSEEEILGSRPKYWLRYTTPKWSRMNLSRKFVGSICDDEERTSVVPLKRLTVIARIRQDFPIIQKSEINITSKGRNNFDFMFIPVTLPEVGEWKIELFLYDNNELIGFTHHEDFEVTE